MMSGLTSGMHMPRVICSERLDETVRLARRSTLAVCPKFWQLGLELGLQLQPPYAPHQHQSDGQRYVPPTPFDKQMPKTALALKKPQTSSRSPPERMVPSYRTKDHKGWTVSESYGTRQPPQAH